MDGVVPYASNSPGGKLAGMPRWIHEHEPTSPDCPICTRYIYLIIIGPPLLVLILAVLYTFTRS
jgi:hypothetical protein